jgi:acyl carrier protein
VDIAVDIAVEIKALRQELKILIIETLDLEDIAAEDIVDSAPLFNDGLGLDSIDALEIGVALQKRYGIKLDPETDDVKRHFASIADLTELVHSHQSSRG